MRKFSSTPLFAQVKEKELMKGWLTKVNRSTLVCSQGRIKTSVKYNFSTSLLLFSVCVFGFPDLF